MKKVWVLHDWLSGGTACFTSPQAMKEFIAKANLELVRNVGEGYCEDDYSTWEAEIDPDFDVWWNS